MIDSVSETAGAAADLKKTRRQKAARRLAEEVYCWEREAPKLLAAVEAALAATP